MKEKLNRANALATKYWDATLSHAEQQELRVLLDSLDNLSDDLAALKIMMQGFEGIADQYNQAETAKPKKSYIFKLATSLSAAAVIAAALILQFRSAPTPEAEIYCYINGEPITDINIAMEQTKYFKSLASLSQSTAILKSLKTE